MRSRPLLPHAALLLTLTAALSSCASLLSPERRVQVAAVATGVTDLKVVKADSGALSVTGKLSGNPFAARFPAQWNGKSVLFAHGYVQPQGRELVPDPATDASGGLLPAAYAEGYATANTAYSKIGYAVKEGVEANKRLRDFMAALGGGNIYMTGGSMGGNITVAMVEQYPHDFAGALPYCGVVSGWAAEERWLFDFRVVYDYFTRNTAYALPGAGAALTPRADYTQDAIVKSVGGLFSAAGQGNAQAAGLIGQITRVTGVPADPISYITPLAGISYGLSDLLATQGGNAVDNTQTVYSGSSDDAALNRGVQRLSANPNAAAFVAANYTPTGKFDVPVLSIHNTSDPLVPYRFEAEYAAIVAKANNSANLVQQVVDPKPVNLADIQNSGPAHCYFTPGQLTFAWNELRAWVENGVRPEAGLNITSK